MKVILSKIFFGQQSDSGVESLGDDGCVRFVEWVEDDLKNSGDCSYFFKKNLDKHFLDINEEIFDVVFVFSLV